MSIATSIEKLSETLTNCKTNLKEKEVADVDNIKISDVDEKIAEIQAGGCGNKATVTFSKGGGNEGSYSVDNNFLTHDMEISGKCVLDINVENSPFDMDNTALERSILIKGKDIDHYNFTVQGEIKNGSGTITITCEDGFGYASTGFTNPFLSLVLRDSELVWSPVRPEDFETHVLFAYKNN